MVIDVAIFIVVLMLLVLMLLLPSSDDYLTIRILAQPRHTARHLRIMKQAVSQFGEHALPEGVSLVRYTSNPNPFRFFRIIIILAIFFFVVFLLFVMVFALAIGRFARSVGRMSVDSFVDRDLTIA